MSDLLERFKERAGEAGILLDFDGTLSAIAELPGEARPYPGVVETLSALTRRYRWVAIVSGRSAYQLVQWLGPDLDIWGVHGAERSRPGEVDVTLSPVAAHFAQLMSEVRDEATARVECSGIPGVLVEDKTVMVGLHFRAAEDPVRAEQVLDQLASELANKYELRRAGGRMAFELRPPMRFSKGDVVDLLARELSLRAVLFAGDDTVDLPGFDALDALAASDVMGVRVGVRSMEAPSDLLERADLTVEGPAGMLELLRRLV